MGLSQNLITVLLSGFGTDGLRRQETMKTTRGRKPRSVRVCRTRGGRSEQILFNGLGCETPKNPATAELFFLDFPFIELTLVSPFKVPNLLILATLSCQNWQWLAFVSAAKIGPTLGFSHLEDNK